MKIEVGKEYNVLRRGWPMFRIRVVELDEQFMLGAISQGTAKFFGMPDRGPGDGIWLDSMNPEITLELVR